MRPLKLCPIPQPLSSFVLPSQSDFGLISNGSRVFRWVDMGEFWRKADQCWNRNRVIAGVLLLAGIACAVWAKVCPQSPGVSIGLVAAAAGIMSLRPKMHLAEKLVW